MKKFLDKYRHFPELLWVPNFLVLETLFLLCIFEFCVFLNVTVKRELVNVYEYYSVSVTCLSLTEVESRPNDPVLHTRLQVPMVVWVLESWDRSGRARVFYSSCRLSWVFSSPFFYCFYSRLLIFSFLFILCLF